MTQSILQIKTNKEEIANYDQVLIQKFDELDKEIDPNYVYELPVKITLYLYGITKNHRNIPMVFTLLLALFSLCFH